MDNKWVQHYWSSTRIILGPDAVRELPASLSPEETHLLVSDAGLLKAGVVDRVVAVLKESGIAHHIFDHVTADPPIGIVEEAVEVCRETGCTAVIGLGGGSSLDTAKGVAVRLISDVSLREYGDGRQVEGPVAPLYAVPTTAGTGSEVTRVAVITDLARQEKMAVRGELLAPRLAVLDPLLLSGLPPRIAAETGADALTHAIEAYTCLNANPLTDALALSAVELIGSNLRGMVSNPGNSEAAGRMLAASCMAGQAFANSGLGLAHSVGEVMGAHFHVSHGLACALYLPVVMDFNVPANPDKFAALARVLGQETTGLSTHRAAPIAVKAVRELMIDVGLPLTFAQAGIKFSLESEMIDDVLTQFSTSVNPRRADRDQIAGIFLAPGE